MSTSYIFYLEKRMEGDKWLPLKYNGDDYFYYVRSYAREFTDEYAATFPIGFNYMNEEFKEVYKEKYNNCDEYEKKLYCLYYIMDLDRILEDYRSEIHEYAGIISKNDLKKVNYSANN